MTDVPVVELAPGVAMPMVGFGTWQLHGRQAYDAVRYALDVGYRHVDTATMYRNEAEIGRAIRDSGLAREALFVTTKLPPGSAGRARATIAESLRALGTDHVDLWLVHWPPRGRTSVPLWQEFLAIRDEGLCRAAGVSNYSLAQIDELIAATKQPPAVNQIPWSPSRYDAALLSGHRDRGVAVEGYSPLKGTRLRDRTLAEIAARHHVTPAQVVLRWHLELGITVIPKSARPERIESNFDLFGFSLTPEEVARLNHLLVLAAPILTYQCTNPPMTRADCPATRCGWQPVVHRFASRAALSTDTRAAPRTRPNAATVEGTRWRGAAGIP